MAMPLFQPTKVRVAFAIALLVLTMAALLSSWNVSRLMETQRQIADANMVLDRSGDLVEALGDSVVASRGIARDADQLFSHSVESMRSAIGDVRQGTIDNPEQQQRNRLLENSLNQVIVLERQRLELAKRKGPDAGDVAIAGGRGREIIDQTRRIIAEMRSAEEAVLSLRKEQQQSRRRTVGVVFSSSVLLGFAILLAVYYHLEREIGRRQQSENEIRRLNEELEQRVLERTSQLCEANSRLAV